MQSDNTIVVTGMGLMTSIGVNISEFWINLLQGKSGVSHWQDLQQQDFKYAHACRIKNVQCEPVHRAFTLAKDAISQAIQQADCGNEKRFGLYLGTTMGESAAFETVAEGDTSLDLHNYTGYAVTKRLSKDFPNVNEFQCFATACSAGNYAIQAGIHALQNKHIDIAIVGGVDPFSKIAMTGFSRSRAMSSSGICQPFSSHRDGMLLGEGAGFLILEPLMSAEERGAEILAITKGSTFSADAYHATAPRPDSTGIIDCFQQWSNHQVDIGDTDWISAHGTGTQLSDQTEAAAIQTVFREHPPLVSSIKGHIGHSLGAASAIEAIVCVLSIIHQTIPQTLHSQSEEFEIPVVTTAMEYEVNQVLNCAYAFGGLNSISIFQRW